jgi:subtilisin-like proprotein convertase family protein
MSRFQGVLRAGSVVLVGSALSLLPVAVQAAVPAGVAVEGALYSAGGGPAADGSYTVTFSLYKDSQTATAAWSESASVTVKGGLFTSVLGLTKALDGTTLTALGAAPVLGVKVDPDPELPRKPVESVLYALRAASAESVACSGCIGTAQLDPTALAPYAKSASLSKAATSGAYADLTGAPDLSVYAKLAALAKVASSGSYADLTGAPDLTAYAKVSSLAKVAGTGAYADLSGTPTLAKVATSGAYADLTGAPVAVAVNSQCGTGLVVKGHNADGSLNCIAAMDLSAIPPDGINEISNNLIYNQFVDTVQGGTAVLIPDNNPVGVSDTLTFPDLGIAQALNVTVDISNSDTKTLKVSVFDPNNIEYVLFNGGAAGSSVKATYPTPTKPVSGDLTTWVGKNPAGKWFLKVVDTGFLNNTKDGQINSWSIGIQTLSSKKVQVKGNLLVDGSVKIGADTAVCDATKVGTLRNATAGVERCDGATWQKFGAGVVYTRWGRTTCPTGITQLYAGYVGSGHYTHSGSGGNQVCLHSQPTWDEYNDGNQEGALIYGTEYENQGAVASLADRHDYDMQCSVCFAEDKNTQFMQPGRNVCPTGWVTEYQGYLMANHYTQQKSEFVCVDRQMEKGGSNSNSNGNLWYTTEAECGSLPCGPYVQNRELTCAVCTR